MQWFSYQCKNVYTVYFLCLRKKGKQETYKNMLVFGKTIEKII